MRGIKKSHGAILNARLMQSNEEGRKTADVCASGKKNSSLGQLPVSKNIFSVNTGGKNISKCSQTIGKVGSGFIFYFLPVKKIKIKMFSIRLQVYVSAN